jgi:hypothetical protein
MGNQPKSWSSTDLDVTGKLSIGMDILVYYWDYNENILPIFI